MLFLFADTPASAPPKPAENVHVYAPGVYHESLNPKSGDVLYLSPGSYFFGSLNLWQVHDVKVLGRGTIVYDGPQDPNNDEGWMQKPDWHCIGAMDAKNVEARESLMEFYFDAPGIAGGDKKKAWALADEIGKIDAARGFFEKRGFSPQSRSTVSVGDEWLANTTMTKPLVGRGRPS